ncbi:MAG: LamG domain-containing protein, partial [Verrucomicrobiota bacterium]
MIDEQTNIAHEVLDFLPERDYFYSLRATNCAETIWLTPSTSFRTFSPLQEWAYRMKVTFCGYTRPELLSNFPALVVLNNSLSGFGYDQFASPAGDDLIFMNSNQTVRLNHEIEQWDTNGSAYVWVQVPELDNNNVPIYAYWGNRQIAEPPVYSTNGAVWDADFEAVYHFDGSADDATANRVHETPVNIEPGDWIPSQAGRGLNLDAVDEYVDTLTPASGLDIDGSKPKTVSGWVFIRDFNFAGLYQSGNLFNPGQDFSLKAQGFNLWRVQLWGTPDFDFNYPSLNRWVHITVVHDGTEGRAYADGQLVGSEASVLDTRDNITFRIGRWRDFYLDGIVDEMRITSGA